MPPKRTRGSVAGNGTTGNLLEFVQNLANRREIKAEPPEEEQEVVPAIMPVRRDPVDQRSLRIKACYDQIQSYSKTNSGKAAVLMQNMSQYFLDVAEAADNSARIECPQISSGLRGDAVIGAMNQLANMASLVIDQLRGISQEYLEQQRPSTTVTLRNVLDSVARTSAVDAVSSDEEQQAVPQACSLTKKTFECPYCDESFKNYPSFRNHGKKCKNIYRTRKRHPKLLYPATCPVCEHVTANAYELTKHIEAVHFNDPNTALFCCSTCRKHYKTAMQIERHWHLFKCFGSLEMRTKNGLPSCIIEGNNAPEEKTAEPARVVDANAAAVMLTTPAPLTSTWTPGRQIILDADVADSTDCEFCGDGFETKHDKQVHVLDCPDYEEPCVRSIDPRLLISMRCPICEKRGDVADEFKADMSAYELSDHFFLDHCATFPYFTCSGCKSHFNNAMELSRHWRRGQLACNGAELVTPTTEVIQMRINREVDQPLKEVSKAEEIQAASQHDLICLICNAIVHFKQYDMHMRRHQEWATLNTLPCPMFRCTYKTISYTLLDHHKRNMHRQMYREKQDAKNLMVEQPMSLGDTPGGSSAGAGNATYLKRKKDYESEKDYIETLKLTPASTGRINLTPFTARMYEPVICTLCDLRCASFFVLNSHLIKEHSDVKGLFFRCGGCDKAYKVSDGLKVHALQMENRNVLECKDMGMVLGREEATEALQKRKADYKSRHYIKTATEGPAKKKARERRENRRKRMSSLLEDSPYNTEEEEEGSPQLTPSGATCTAIIKEEPMDVEFPQTLIAAISST